MVNILIAGDFGPRYRVGENINKGDYTCLDELIPYTTNCDYSILNLESPLYDGDGGRIHKAGPSLKSPIDSVKVLERSGFNCVTLANNHFRDFGDEGVKSTIKTLVDHGIDYVGGGLNIKQARKVLYKTIKGVKIAFINICENEFSIATEEHGGSAPIDTPDNYYAISEAKQNSDIVILIIHGGHQHYSYPDKRMKKLYRYYADIGADVVINHHQHCYSGYEEYHGVPIFYGLGNFCFDKPGYRDNSWNEGYLVKLSIEDKIEYEIIPYIQCNHTPTVEIMKGNDREKFELSLIAINNIIADDVKLKEKFDEFCKKREHSIMATFSPWKWRIFRGLAKVGILPYMLSIRKICGIQDYISCESQRELTLQLFDNKIN